MIKKEHIKELLEVGFKIELPYKQKINRHYTNIGLSKLDDQYIINPHWIKFYDIDEAINYFLNEAVTSKNKGYIQERLSKKINFEYKYDLEKPNKELIKLFKDEGKLVDEEYKELGISVKKFPTAKKAVEEFETIVKNIDVKSISESLLSFDKKYSMLDTYISMSFVYEPDGILYTHEYRSSFEFEDFTLKRLEKAKSTEIKGYKYKNLEVTLKLRGDDEYHRYEIKV